MQKEPTKRELRRLAAQLRCPTGPMGIEIGELMSKSNLSMTLEGVASLDLIPNNTILELGHGNCDHLQKILVRDGSLTYYGLEISKLMVAEAEKTNESYVNKERASFAWYDGIQIPFRDNGFDKILTVNTIYFWQEPLVLLNELYRVLRPKGKLVIVFASREFMLDIPFTKYGFTMYRRQEFKNLVDQTKFSIQNIKRKKDFVKNKLGNFVERAYLIATLTKIIRDK